MDKFHLYAIAHKKEVAYNGLEAFNQQGLRYCNGKGVERIKVVSRIGAFDKWTNRFQNHEDGKLQTDNVNFPARCLGMRVRDKGERLKKCGS